MKQLRQLVKTVFSVIIVRAAVLLGFLAYVAPRLKDAPFLRVSAAPVTTPTPKVLPPEQTGSPSYEALCSPLVSNQWTTAQNQSYVDNLKGKRVTGWKWYVQDVREDRLSPYPYTVYLYSESSRTDWEVRVDTRNADVLYILKDKPWEFSGTLTGGRLDTSFGNRDRCVFFFTQGPN